LGFSFSPLIKASFERFLNKKPPRFHRGGFCARDWIFFAAFGCSEDPNGGLTQSLSPPMAVPAFSFTRFCEQVHNARK